MERKDGICGRYEMNMKCVRGPDLHGRSTRSRTTEAENVLGLEISPPVSDAHHTGTKLPH